MAQASSAQREPSMEEILASIRRIIEDNDAGRKQPGEPEQSRAAAPAPVRSGERTVIEVDAFRNELRTPPAEAAPAPREAPQKKPVTLAEVQAQITAEAAAMPSRWMDLPAAPSACRDEPVAEMLCLRAVAGRHQEGDREFARRARGRPRAARHTRAGEHRPGARAAQERAGVGSGSGDRGTACDRDAEPSGDDGKRRSQAALLSERVERQVAASFSELSEAFAARSRKTFDEMAEEMIAPLLRDWMENNLPTLVERLVREEIERVARGAQ